MEVGIKAGTIPTRDGIEQARSQPNYLSYLEFLGGEASRSPASKPD
jgi:hypothetical protein